jgi:hypothetical protein
MRLQQSRDTDPLIKCLEGRADEKRCGGEEEAGGGEAAEGAAHQGAEGTEQGGHQLLEEEQDRGGGKVTIYAPMIYTAPCIMFWMHAYPLRGQVGEGWALEFESFLGPVKWHPADRSISA